MTRATSGLCLMSRNGLAWNSHPPPIVPASPCTGVWAIRQLLPTSPKSVAQGLEVTSCWVLMSPLLICQCSALHRLFLQLKAWPDELWQTWFQPSTHLCAGGDRREGQSDETCLHLSCAWQMCSDIWNCEEGNSLCGYQSLKLLAEVGGHILLCHPCQRGRSLAGRVGQWLGAIKL